MGIINRHGSGQLPLPFRLLLNTGEGYFESVETEINYPDEVYTPAIAVGDPDTDGDMDIVLGTIGVIPEEGFPYDGPGASFFRIRGEGYTARSSPMKAFLLKPSFAAFLDLDDDLDQEALPHQRSWTRGSAQPSLH